MSNDNNEKKKIIVVAPHPDDETLGCGGTILKHRENGDEVYWLIITNILESDGWEKEKVKTRQCEIEKVSGLYGFKKTFKLDFSTCKLDAIPIGSLVSGISKVISEVEPHTIYINNRSDIHTDHHVSFQALISCTKNFRYPYIKRILMYETLSETEFSPALSDGAFIPNVFNDISEFYFAKINILQVYRSEVMEGFLPRSLRSVESLAMYRGSRIGVEYAESFSLIQEIN